MSHLATAETKGLFKTVVRPRGETFDKTSETQVSVYSATTMEEAGPGFAMLPGLHATEQSVVNRPNRKRV